MPETKANLVINYKGSEMCKESRIMIENNDSLIELGWISRESSIAPSFIVCLVKDIIHMA